VRRRGPTLLALASLAWRRGRRGADGGAGPPHRGAGPGAVRERHVKLRARVTPDGLPVLRLTFAADATVCAREGPAVGVRVDAART